MNYVSIKQIIARVYDNADVEEELPFDRLYQWIGEALKKINIELNLSMVRTSVRVEDYRAAPPCGVYRLVAIEQGGVTMRLNSGNDPKAASCVTRYKPNGAWVDFNFECGEVTFVYYTMLLDEDGLPMIPDEEFIKEALWWYIENKLAYIRWRNAEPRTAAMAQYIYRESKNEFERYATYAKTKHKMPDEAVMQNFTEHWNSLMDRNNLYDTGFNNYGTREHLVYAKGVNPGNSSSNKAISTPPNQGIAQR